MNNGSIACICCIPCRNRRFHSIGTSMILGSISPILLMHRGGSLVQLINNTFSGANSTPILAVPLFILGGVIMAKRWNQPQAF